MSPVACAVHKSQILGGVTVAKATESKCEIERYFCGDSKLNITLQEVLTTHLNHFLIYHIIMHFLSQNQFNI